jgi:hypothetical protein
MLNRLPQNAFWRVAGFVVTLGFKMDTWKTLYAGWKLVSGDVVEVV